jgi:hypothetical protein
MRIRINWTLEQRKNSAEGSIFVSKMKQTTNTETTAGGGTRAAEKTYVICN